MNKTDIWNIIQEDYDRKDFAIAYEKVSQLLSKDPDNIDIFYVQAVLSSRLLKHNETIDFCDKILQIDPQNISALRIKASTFESTKNYDDSYKIYNQILKIIPNDPQALLGKAYYLAENRNNVEYRKTCTRLINIHTDNVDTLKNILTFFEIFAHKYREAVMVCDKILKIDSKDIDIQVKKATLLFHIKEYKRAVITTNKILLQDSLNVMAHVIKMNALEELEQYDDVLVMCDKLLTTFDENNINILQTKALMLNKIQNYDSCIKIYEKLICICEEQLMYGETSNTVKNTLLNAKLYLNVAKINSNKKFSIHEGFDFLVNYFWLYLLKF